MLHRVRRLAIGTAEVRHGGRRMAERCYGQRRFGGRCLLSARPMMAAFSSWLSSRLPGLRFGTIGNKPGWRAGPAVDVAWDGGGGEGAPRSGLGVGAG